MKKRWLRMEWNNAPDIKKRVLRLIKDVNLESLNSSNIHFFRSCNSSSRAYARIWGLSKVWQKALKTDPAYIIEVLSERFDKLSENEKDKVLLHELAHVPKNFSGSLLPHSKKGKRNFNDKVEELFTEYLRKTKT